MVMAEGGGGIIGLACWVQWGGGVFISFDKLEPDEEAGKLPKINFSSSRVPQEVISKAVGEGVGGHSAITFTCPNAISVGAALECN